MIGCSTFPTWNGYPGLFASLVTGNAVVIKPHPGAILPLALTASVARDVLREEGFDADLVTLAADAPGRRASCSPRSFPGRSGQRSATPRRRPLKGLRTSPLPLEVRRAQQGTDALLRHRARGISCCKIALVLVDNKLLAP